MDAPTARTLLITLSGIDRPGVTRRLFAALAEHPVTVLDIEQLVVRSRLVLAALVEVTGDAAEMTATRAAVRHLAADLDMDVETVPGAAEDDERRHNRIHVTMLGAPLLPGDIAEVAAQIADRGGNIDRIRRMASYPVTAITFEGSGVSAEELRRPLAAVAAARSADIAVQEAGLDRRGQYLVVMDVDSTFIQDEVIDLLADEAGVLDRGRRDHRAGHGRGARLRAVAAGAGGAPRRAAVVLPRSRTRAHHPDAGSPHAVPHAAPPRLPHRAGVGRVHRRHRAHRGRARGQRRAGEHPRVDRRRAHRPGRRPGRGPDRARATPSRPSPASTASRSAARSPSATGQTTSTCLPRRAWASPSTPRRRPAPSPTPR